MTLLIGSSPKGKAEYLTELLNVAVTYKRIELDCQGKGPTIERMQGTVQRTAWKQCEIGRILHLRSEIRNLKLQCSSSQRPISDLQFRICRIRPISKFSSGVRLLFGWGRSCR
ncbi:MAG: hypothetical protein DMG15_23440 [Acidobacteria bacterium]|nr:MAG: hypothetical protein DMG15_23440 [Acidobacteriota bacterium]